MRRLVLFDIDGTLVSDHGAPRRAFEDALRKVFSFDGDMHRYDFSGRTDPQIARMILSDAGLDEEEIGPRLDALFEHYLERLADAASSGEFFALPGIREILAELDAHPEVLLALLTGNIEPGARIKLQGPDLNRYFPFGAFGSDSPRREELPPIAVERASAACGRRFSKREVVIIGDSIFDVRCGVPHEATTIAIASGKTEAARLRAENPIHFFPDATDTAALLAAILG